MSDVAKEYGAALYQLAREDGIEDQLLDETRTAAAVFKENPAYLSLLSSPDLSKEERSGAVAKAFAGAHRYLINFFSMMVERGYSRDLPACLDEYLRLFREDHGIAVAKIASARPLSDGEKTKLTAALERRYGVKVEPEYRVDPSLIGGMKVEISGTLLDGSVRRRLDGVKADLSTLTL